MSFDEIAQAVWHDDERLRCLDARPPSSPVHWADASPRDKSNARRRVKVVLVTLGSLARSILDEVTHPKPTLAAMATSAEGIELIKAREGCVLHAYLDSVGVPTIGVGHTAGVTMGETCTDQQALDWLREDLRWSEAAVNNGVKVPLEQHQFDALVSFVFNVGQGAFNSSTLLRMLNAGDYAGAALQMDRWHIPPEITSRRNGEREQFRGTRFVARI